MKYKIFKFFNEILREKFQMTEVQSRLKKKKNSQDQYSGAWVSNLNGLNI